jgi:hypothetical protein
MFNERIFPMKRVVLASTLGALMLAANMASAAITQVASVAGLTQGPYTLETFDDLALVPGVTASASSGIAQATTSFSPSFPSGTSGLTTGTFPDPITFTFASAASSVGMFFGNDDTCCTTSVFDAALDIFGAGGLIDTIFVTANMNDETDQFIGFISDEAVTSVTIRYGSGSDITLYTVVDDLRFNTAAAIPLPAGLPLAMTGLAALTLLRRRKT